MAQYKTPPLHIREKLSLILHVSFFHFAPTPLTNKAHWQNYRRNEKKEYSHPGTPLVPPRPSWQDWTPGTGKIPSGNSIYTRQALPIILPRLDLACQQRARPGAGLPVPARREPARRLSRLRERATPPASRGQRAVPGSNCTRRPSELCHWLQHAERRGRQVPAPALAPAQWPPAAAGLSHPGLRRSRWVMATVAELKAGRGVGGCRSGWGASGGGGGDSDHRQGGQLAFSRAPGRSSGLVVASGANGGRRLLTPPVGQPQEKRPQTSTQALRPYRLSWSGFHVLKISWSTNIPPLKWLERMFTAKNI